VIGLGNSVVFNVKMVPSVTYTLIKSSYTAWNENIVPMNNTTDCR